MQGLPEAAPPEVMHIVSEKKIYRDVKIEPNEQLDPLAEDTWCLQHKICLSMDFEALSFGNARSDC